jgi:fibronectin type 3 domain-containing protein
VKLEWLQVPKLVSTVEGCSSAPIPDPQIAGYHVYRRNSVEEKKFQKLTEQPVTGSFYLDDTIEENMQYLYSVVAVDSQGRESKFPLEVNCYTRSLYIASITEDTEGKRKGR